MKTRTSNHIQSFESSESFPSFKSSSKSSESSESSKSSLTLSNVIKFDSIKSTKTSIQRFENKMKVFNSIICWSSMMMIMMIVMVKAFNSPPVFDFKREIFVPENTPVGQMVSMVRTIDKENDIITYGLDPAHWNDGSKYFRIDEKTGQIFLRESLNGQGGNFLNMYIKANDGHQTAKIEAVISVSKANDKGHIVHYPDVHSPSSSSASSASSSQIYNVNNIFNKSLIPPPPPPPKDIPLESLSKPKQTSSRRPRPPISKVNTFTTNKSKLQQQQQQQQQQNQQSNNDTLKTLKSDQSQQSKISIESNNVRNDNDDDDDIRLINQPKSFELFDLLWPIGPYILISIFVPTLCLLFWCWIHKRNMPSRNAIKTFSHKIISNNNNNNNNSNKSDNQSIETTTNSFTGDFDCLSPFNKTNSILKYHETSNDNFNVNNYFISSQSSATPNRWEYPRHHLRFMHIVGQGCFGQVWKCELINNNHNHNNTNQIVAVKTLKENVSEKEKRNLLDELEVMKILDPHPNVVTLIGCCTERDPVYLIMEYVPLGKLQKYLLDNREDLTFNNSNNNNGGYSKQSTNNNNNRIESQDLISFAYQIAKGMEYLSSKGIIHRDLAARNILVGHNKICKIADFGLAKYNQEIYERKSEGRLPIRWMAIESLKDFIFTTKSDVWSFGILMWEIVTLGCTPYPGWTASEVIKRVNEGYRLEKPEHCKREMYNIMYYCWDRNPHHRPSFSELVCLLDNLFGADDEYIELDRFPDHCYYNLLKPPGCNSNNSGEKL